MRYADRVVVVTGAARGIGAGCAGIFVEAGAKVIVSDRREDEGREVVSALNARGPGEAHFIQADVTDVAQIERLIDETVARYGRIDCLLNNAGWHPPHLPIDQFSVQDFRNLIDLNVISVFAACKAALPHLRKTRGSIINIASLVATLGQHYATTYVATKGAVLSFTKALAIEEAPMGVRVNSVSPGNIWTPLWKEAVDASSDPARTRADGEAAQWLARMGTPEEVGRLCLFLAADATFTTGVDHLITGGAEIGYGAKVNP
ncbi:MAG: SDR family oxidoreductase [Blastocatellia bacterium]|nr:SDR family oxidoreductase [Blastocatellia bacterium]